MEIIGPTHCDVKYVEIMLMNIPKLATITFRAKFRLLLNYTENRYP